MKKILFFIAALATFVSAEETCNVNGSYQGIPEGSCIQSGYICNLAMDVNNEQKVMAFHLGVDQTCQTVLSTKFETTRVADNTTTTVLRLFLIESEEYHTDALGMTLAGSLALSASNNKTPVSVIYHKVGNSEYGGVLLQSISQIGN